jgi:hypothetical protein
MTQCEMYVCLRVKRVKCEPHRTGMGSMIYTIDIDSVTWIFGHIIFIFKEKKQVQRHTCFTSATTTDTQFTRYTIDQPIKKVELAR